jgi:predicted GIY-YIG superfamily endonuclease
MFWVYMLKCADRSFYVGHTENLEVRVGQHQVGIDPSCYTFNRRPLELVFSQPFDTRVEALTMERRIKGWSRAKKTALIAGDWTEISRISCFKYKNKSPSTGSGRTA